MAVVRARSAPPYALIIFIFLWVISTGLAIYFMVRVGKVEKASADAQARLNRAVGRSDQQIMEKLLAGKPASASALAVADNYIKQLRNVIKNNDAASTEEILADAGRALDKSGKKDSQLVPVLEDLANQNQQKDQQIASLQTQVKTLQDTATQTAQTNQGALKAAQDSLNAQKAATDKSIAEAAAERADKENLVKASADELTKTKDAAEADRRKAFLEIENLKAELAARQQRLDILTRQITEARQGNKTLAGAEPAGIIVRARPGTDECYINLGRKDRIVPGLTFAVYDSRLGIRVGQDVDPAKVDPEAGGKGGIEVVEVGETESLCRIEFQKKGQHIQQGDLISNPVYQHDKNKKFHFVVFGDFDLDGDGVATGTERDRLVRMITAWGGLIDEQLTPESDFLVLGHRPSTPIKSTGDETGGIVDERVKLQKQYDDLAVEAKRSSVPILNSNRFLAMIGYYNTSIVQ